MAKQLDAQQKYYQSLPDIAEGVNKSGFYDSSLRSKSEIEWLKLINAAHKNAGKTPFERNIIFGAGGMVLTGDVLQPKIKAFINPDYVKYISDSFKLDALHSGLNEAEAQDWAEREAKLSGALGSTYMPAGIDGYAITVEMEKSWKPEEKMYTEQYAKYDKMAESLKKQGLSPNSEEFRAQFSEAGMEGRDNYNRIMMKETLLDYDKRTKKYLDEHKGEGFFNEPFYNLYGPSKKDAEALKDRITNNIVLVRSQNRTMLEGSFNAVEETIADYKKTMDEAVKNGAWYVKPGEYKAPRVFWEMHLADGTADKITRLLYNAKSDLINPTDRRYWAQTAAMLELASYGDRVLAEGGSMKGFVDSLCKKYGLEKQPKLAAEIEDTYDKNYENFWQQYGNSLNVTSYNDELESGTVTAADKAKANLEAVIKGVSQNHSKKYFDMLQKSIENYNNKQYSRFNKLGIGLW